MNGARGKHCDKRRIQDSSEKYSLGFELQKDEKQGNKCSAGWVSLENYTWPHKHLLHSLEDSFTEEKHSEKIFEELISFFSHLSAFVLQGPYTHTFQQCLHRSQQHKPLDIPALRSQPLLERQGAGDVGKLFLNL